MNLQLDQSAYWNEVAHQKTFNHAVDWQFLGPRLSRESRILDYGCGYGRLTVEFVKRGYPHIMGLDNSAGMIARATREHPALSFTHLAESKLPIESESLDLVLLFAVLTCIPMTRDQAALCGEISRVLKPGGLLYISDLLINGDARNIARYEATALKPYGVFEHSEGVVLRHHKLEYLKEILLSGFGLIYQNTFEVRTMNGNASRAVQLIGSKQEA